MSPIHWHALFELLAYFVGARLFFWLDRRAPAPAWRQDLTARLGVLTGAILGAALGSKVAYWVEDPLAAFARFPDVLALMAGKSIVGGLLGGLIGVEIAKKLVGIAESTGDRFVWPLAVGMAIGRIGCHLGGLGDHTVGLPTALPWGYDYGDGVPRHPTALYEIAFLLGWTFLITRRAWPRHGDTFRLFLAGYLFWRLCVEWIKPIPMVYFGALSGIQVLCLAGLCYYGPDLVRIIRSSPWARR